MRSSSLATSGTNPCRESRIHKDCVLDANYEDCNIGGIFRNDFSHVVLVGIWGKPILFSESKSQPKTTALQVNLGLGGTVTVHLRRLLFLDGGVYKLVAGRVMAP